MRLGLRHLDAPVAPLEGQRVQAGPSEDAGEQGSP
jgi:hypothetical protein